MSGEQSSCRMLGCAPTGKRQYFTCRGNQQNRLKNTYDTIIKAVRILVQFREKSQKNNENSI